jgi:hypothetical protein
MLTYAARDDSGSRGMLTCHAMVFYLAMVWCVNFPWQGMLTSPWQGMLTSQGTIC